MPGVYPPFLLKPGNRISEDMRKKGVAAKEFLTNIKDKEIDIPVSFVIQDLNNSSTFNFQTNLDHHLLNIFQIKHNFSHISIKRTNLPSNIIENTEIDVTESNVDSESSESSNDDSESSESSNDDDIEIAANVNTTSETRHANRPVFTPAETRKVNRYLAPELYSERELRIQTGMDRESFKTFCNLRADRCISRSRLSVSSQILLYIQRYRKAKPYLDLSVDFSLGTQSVFNIVEKLMFSEVKKSTNIPYYIQSFNIDQDVSATMEFIGKECPPLLANLAKEFRDPTGRNRKVAMGFLDATYLYTARSSNPMMQKITFCKFKGQNVIKVSAITTATGKTLEYFSL